ncbi:proliferation-associated protein 1 [Neoconidiobolus thromboides FSU 785]|nr:proliferation-associated protein 1 [Neoconidiobolus thromboides FSU 785]
MSTEQDTKIDNTIGNQEVLLKFNAASTIAQNALAHVVEHSKEGAKIIDLCKLGDEFIVDATSKIFKDKKKMSKGIAFPTCISLNNLACHVSPLESDPEATIELKKGDLVKIELGAQIDGFPGLICHSFVVGASKEEPATGKNADTILAAHYAVEAAYRLLRPQNKNSQVTEIVQKVCEVYGTKPAEGMLSYQLEKDFPDNTKQIILNPNDAQRSSFKTVAFEENEVYALVVVVSSGDGKLKESGLRTTVYKRTESSYQLKMKAARTVNSEIKKFGKFPFSLRALEDERNARMGIVECARSGIVNKYDIVGEKQGEVVASFMYTVMVTPKGNVRTTTFPLDLDAYKSEKKIEDQELLKLLETSVDKPKKVKKPKAPKA